MNTNEQVLQEIPITSQAIEEQENKEPETPENTPKQNHHNSAAYAARLTHSAVNQVLPRHRPLEL